MLCGFTETYQFFCFVNKLVVSLQAVEMARVLRALDALPEALGSIPRTQGIQYPLLASAGTRHHRTPNIRAGKTLIRVK